MICLACNRKDVRYPVIDWRTDATCCPYCSALDTLIPGEGETEESIKELRKFAEEQGWRFRMMETTDTIKDMSHEVKDMVILLYAEQEGEMMRPLFLPTATAEEQLRQYHEKGTITTLSMSYEFKEVPVRQLVVTYPAQYLYKVPDVRQVVPAQSIEIEFNIPPSEGGTD